MSKLFDKEVNAQKESLKKTSGAHESSHKPMKKCAMKMNERRRKSDVCIKCYWWKEVLYRAHTKNNKFKVATICLVKLIDSV